MAKKIRRYEFPDKDLANKAWTHNLDVLVNLAELRGQLDNDMAA